MNWIDYALIAIIAISFLVGVFRGLIREVLSLITWILAFALSLGYGPVVAEELAGAVEIESLRYFLGYAICFFGTLIVGGLLGLLVGLLIRGSVLSGLDRLLGAGFGFVRGILVAVFLVLLVGYSEFAQHRDWRRSRLVPALRPAALQLQALIPASWLAHLLPDPAEPATKPVAVPRPLHHPPR